jgi:hypothetical protein
MAFEFVPASGNVVGNYPPGYMVPASTVLKDAIAALNGLNSNGTLLRDMGKTVKCGLGGGSPSTPVAPANANVRFFRQVQLVTPVDQSSVVGGVSGNTFGVQGGVALPSSSPNAPFMVFYVAIASGELLGAGPYAVPSLSGQL